MPYIFLDESGQFSKNNNENYFIVGAFTVDDPKKTNKLFRSWHRSKFPLNLKFKSEVKFSGSIEDSIRIKTLKFISGLNIKINFVYFKKTNMYNTHTKALNTLNSVRYTFM